MKKTATILLVLVSTGAFLTAATNGRRDNDRYNDDNRRGGMYEDREDRMEEFLEDATIVTISGKLELVNGEFAKLVSGGTTYTIMVPPQELMDLKVTNGKNVTLEGVEQYAPLMWDGKEKFFIVTKITIDGKTTTIDHDRRGGMMGYGFYGRGMMGEGIQGKGFRN